MTSFRFVHAADLHLDTPFEGVARPAPAVAEALRDASLEAWDTLVRLTISEKAAFLLLAGDVYDGAERGLRAQLRFVRGLQQLAEHHIQVFIVSGNHDPVEEGWSAVRRWPPNVVMFGHEEVGAAAALHANGAQLAVVRGISYGRRDVTENLAKRFAAGSAAGIADQGLHIALLHCTVGTTTEHAPYSPCSLADLAAAPVDYWALGHIHARHTPQAGEPWVVYPGNLQGRSPKPSETQAKGALVVEVESDAVREVRFAACDSIRFVNLALDTSSLTDLPALQAELMSAAAAAQTAHGSRDLLLRAALSGRGALHADLRRPGALDTLLEALREECGEARPFLWWNALRDETRAALDRDAIAARADFSAELLAVSGALAADDAALQQQLAALNSGLPARRLPHAAGAVDDPAALLAAAEETALDLLEGGD